MSARWQGAVLLLLVAAACERRPLDPGRVIPATAAETRDTAVTIRGGALPVGTVCRSETRLSMTRSAVALDGGRRVGEELRTWSFHEVVDAVVEPPPDGESERTRLTFVTDVRDWGLDGRHELEPGLEGKTYVLTVKGGEVSMERPDGKRVPADEVAKFQARHPGWGHRGSMSELLAGAEVRAGDLLEVPRERLGDVFAPGAGIEVIRAQARVVEIRQTEGRTEVLLHFNIEAARRDPERFDARILVTGPCVIDAATGVPLEWKLTGPGTAGGVAR